MSINTNESLNDLNRSLKMSEFDFELKKPHNNNLIKKVTFPDDSQALVDHSESPDQSFASITTTTESVVNNKIVKRKIVRKINKTNSDEQDLIKSFENLKNLSHSDEERDDPDSQYHSADEDKEQYLKLNDCYAPINYPIKSCNYN